MSPEGGDTVTRPTVTLLAAGPPFSLFGSLVNSLTPQKGFVGMKLLYYQPHHFPHCTGGEAETQSGGVTIHGS